jgi:5-methylcytosine-specific restriction endonuclease McrA
MKGKRLNCKRSQRRNRRVVCLTKRRTVQKHTKVYLNAFGYSTADFIACEACGKKAVDVHHLNGRGPGKDVPENLMALCLDCHDKIHSRSGGKAFNELCKRYHAEKLRLRGYADWKKALP